MFSYFIITAKLPLIFFTLLFQMSLGVSWGGAILHLKQANTNKATNYLFFTAGILSFISILMLLFYLKTSLQHGQTLFSLSFIIEISLLSLFCLSLLILWHRTSSKYGLLISFILGIASLWIISLLAITTAQTTSNYFYTLFRFASASLLLGTATTYLISFSFHSSREKITHKIHRYWITMGIFGLLLEFTYLPLYLSQLHNMNMKTNSLLTLLANYRFQLLVFISLLCISVILYAIPIWANIKQKHFPIKSFFLVGFIFILLAFFLERNTFYTLATHNTTY